MGLFEFFGEHVNPGNVGHTEKIDPDQLNKDKVILILKSIVSVAIVIGAYILIFGWKFQLKGFLIYTGTVFAYCIVSYWIVPKPDYSNIGWLGGLMDHPFRYSDDLNRMLIFFLIILYPGRLISTTIYIWILLLRKKNSKNK
ncbi:MAG: hypothetical protein ACOYIG_11615 [Acetivibrionales bacterium]|jgi:hypothetical protein